MRLEGLERIPSGCAICGIFSRSGKKFDGSGIVKSIAVMHDRSNGLGGGFAGYGIYPEYKDYYALHLFFDDTQAKKNCEDFLGRHFDIAHYSEIPTKRTPGVDKAPLIWRYFAAPHTTKLSASQLDEKEYVVKQVFYINTEIKGCHVVSSGKNMGVFKGVGYPEDIAKFYMLEDYRGYCFTAHGRYPTNTPGWWGGAHPFGLLDYSVVHNGEISSYDANRRSIEMYGYNCALKTDTEVITYIIDYLHRRKGLTLEEISWVVAAPFWQTIEDMPEEDRKIREYLRNAFSDQLITGPFSIIVGFEGGMMALNDRLKLRSMVVGEKGDMVYISSEEAAIRLIEPDLDCIWSPKGGEAVIVTLDNELEGGGN
ncbi:MAG: glutamine amidotransferase family protein [Clostridiales bacterium]|jgi:glutamate synthase domain-containing protein 1|nr:glutamine amidotransferase family protein [Clostridiales bacterium]